MGGVDMTRRGFMKGAAAGAAALSLGRAATPATGALGASDKLVMGVIGTGGQGTYHVTELAKRKDVTIAAICDVDQSRREKAAKAAGSSPELYTDFRKVLDRKDIDVVLIATPGHWHAINTIRACEAGKDVYLEKPSGHTIHEGRAIVEAAKKHNRIVQVGTQQRSSPHWIHAVERIKAGELGKISMVHVWNAWNPAEMFSNIGNPPDADPPPGVDYEMWLGPAKHRRFNPLHFHGTHYFFWEYGGGMMVEWAVHLFDVVLWAMGTQIDAVSAGGGKLVFDDARETPDTATATFDCPGYNMVYTMRHGNGWRPYGDRDHGIEFFGTERTLHVNRLGFQIHRDEDRGSRKPFYEEKGDTLIPDHHTNFVECVRSRKQPNADALAGHLGAIPGHLANIAYRVGRRIRWDAQTETIIGDAEASKLLTREYRAPWHL